MLQRSAFVFLLFCGCATQSATAENNPKSPSANSRGDDFTLLRKSTSVPERGQREGATLPPLSLGSTAAEQTPTMAPNADGCGAEVCEGNLSPAAIAKLRKTAELAHDCYERELKEHDQVEGRVTVLLRLLGVQSHEKAHCPVQLENQGMGMTEPFKQCLIALFSKVVVAAEGGCVDVALPLVFVRKEVEGEASGAPAVAGAPESSVAPASKPLPEKKPTKSGQ